MKTIDKIFRTGLIGVIIGLLALASENYNIGMFIVGISAVLLILSNMALSRELKDLKK